MPEADSFNTTVIDHYDNAMYSNSIKEYYGDSGFYNYGYWTDATRCQREASENLVDILLEGMPRKRGPILDVACGMGASTERLLRYLPASDIIGTNISEKQLASCYQRAPEVPFFLMDATELAFPGNSFSNILCVEAAFHFNTREAFLHEAYRVLEPGGCLALSDILFRSQNATASANIPLGNFHLTPDDYRCVFERCGFSRIHITEARTECWEGFRDSVYAHVTRRADEGTIPPSAVEQVVKALRLRNWILGNYILVWAIKADA